MKDRPRIAIIIDTLNGGGAEKVCLTLCKACVDRGYDAHLIVLKKKCEYHVSNDLTIHFIFDNPKTQLYRPKIQIEAAHKLQQLTQNLGGFDLHFSNLDECHPIVAEANLPNSYYVLHNSLYNILKRSKRLGPFKYWRKKRLFSALNHKHLIAVSEGVKNEVEKGDLIQQKSITTIYNPLDLAEINRLANVPDANIPEEPYIIFVGRVAAQKRIDILFEAFKQLNSDISLVLLCGASKKLTRLQKKMDLNKKVIVQPFQQNPYPWMANAKALILSSDFEGFGMVLIEALACKTQVVSTDCPHGPNEILTGNLRQFLCPIQSPQLLAEKIALAISQTEPPEPPSILNEVSLDKVVNKYLSLERR